MDLRRLAERVGFEPTVEFPLHTLSKRAQSTTLPSLRLESAICGRSGSDYRKTLLQILLFCDATCIQQFTDGADSIVMEIVSDLLMSFDHLRRSRTRGSVFTDEAMEPVVPLRGMAL